MKHIRVEAVDLPASDWWLLAQEAEARGIKVADVITRILDTHLHPNHTPTPMTALEQLNAELSEARRRGYRAPNHRKKTAA